MPELRRVNRSGRINNAAQVRAYQRSLQAVFDDWLPSGGGRRSVVKTLTDRLQEAASANFQAAFLRGKRQALRRSELTAHDRMQLAGLLAMNRQFLDGSLREDIEAKIVRQRLDGSSAFAETIRRAFQSRIVDNYGGVLWKVTEAGFQAGNAEIRRRLARLARSLALSQEDGDDIEDPPDEAEPSDASEEGLAVLALALGLTVADLLAMRDRLSAVQVGLQYEASNDGDTCESCHDAAIGGDGGEGLYFDEPCPLPGDSECRGNCRCVVSTVVRMGLMVI